MLYTIDILVKGTVMRVVFFRTLYYSEIPLYIMKKGFAIFLLVFICFGLSNLKTCLANEIKKLSNGLIVISASTMKKAMHDVFVEVFESTPDYCNTSECIKIKDHPYFIPPAYIFYRVNKSGNWYHGESTVDDTIDGIRYFSFGRWQFIPINTDGIDIKRVNDRIE